MEALQKCISVLLLTVSYLAFWGFWVVLIYGHYWYGYTEESEDVTDWNCYAPQDKDVTEPYMGPLGSEPDNYHDVSQNFKVCARMGFYTYIYIGFVLALLQVKGFLDVAAIFAAPGACLWVTNMLVVMIYRWRHAG